MTVLLEILCALWIVASVNGQTGKERSLKRILNQSVELYKSCCVNIMYTEFRFNKDAIRYNSLNFVNDVRALIIKIV